MLALQIANWHPRMPIMSTREGSARREVLEESWSTSLDRFGRVVVPKAVRDLLGVRAGDELVVTVDAEGMRLTPRIEPADLEVRDGVLVFCGELVGNVGDAIAAVRDERLRGLMGRVEP